MFEGLLENRMFCRVFQICHIPIAWLLGIHIGLKLEQPWREVFEKVTEVTKELWKGEV